jgi:pimeloyl-ACP methyl ester carboxylesterase
MRQLSISAYRFLCVLVVAFAATLFLPLDASAQLSQNSGINSNDTWVTFDLTIQTQTSSSSLAIPTFTQTYHMELGYDTSGQIVVNLWPTGGSPFPGEYGTISVIRFSGGNITLFDQNGNPIPFTPPTTNASAFNPVSMLGTNPGASVLSRLVVPNIQQRATKANAELVYTSPTYYLTTTYSSGPLTSEQWAYVVSGSQYVATQATFYLNVANNTITRTLQFANVQWNDNSANDSARASAGFTAVAPPATTTSALPALSQSSPTGCPAASSNQGGTQNAAFQYGLFGSNCSWKRMIPWLNDYFVWGNELAPTNVNTLQTIENQASTLSGDITAAGGSNYILVGHSQGGLVSRYAAQEFQAANPNQTAVKGVLTVDTPNQGAPLADWGQVTTNALLEEAGSLWQYVGCSSITDNWFCFLLGILGNGVELAANGLYGSSALGELQPGSGFLTSLNSQTESFQKVAAIGHTSRPWVEVRVADSLFAPLLGIGDCYPEQWCGERNTAAVYGYIFDGVFVTWAISELLCDFTGDYIPCEIAYYLFPIWVTMAEITAGWNFITTVTPQQAAAGYLSPFWNDEDGIVPAPSQNYPATGGSTAYQYSVNPSDSHTGNTKSDLTRNVLEAALGAAQPFNVPKQASCIFSSSSTTDSISGNGGSGTFSLTTSSGCRWNAVSENSWISITSGSESNSSGSIGFAAAANPLTIPRTGTIAAGNGTTGVTFYVDQGALCTYSLSPSGPLAIQPSGGTFSVAVSTGADCPWSAVSNTSWITITGGASGSASGTSSGSFSFTAASNSQATDLTGTITVMNQTLTVIIGSPVGTPGTGSVTIQGSAQDQTFYMCSPQYGGCPATIPETGTVSITVGSQTFMVGYGPTNTAAGLASSLAGQINSQSSLISASVSGSTVTITSTINGAATNYPLSTSYTFNSPYTSPAFWSYASGSSLTGGTN